jgi:hypothetical protein
MQQQQAGASADDMQVDTPATTQQQQQQQQEQQQQQQRQLSRGLAREAAHNLVLIYKGSGAHDLARLIMEQYLTI